MKNSDAINRVLRNTEISLIIILHIFIGLEFLNIKDANIAILVVLSLISAIYLYRLFERPYIKSRNRTEIVIYKFAAFSWFYVSLAIIFHLANNLYSYFILSSACTLLILSLILFSYLKLRNKKFKLPKPRDIIRTIILLIISLILFFT